MSDTSEEEGAEGDVDHCLGDVEALLVISHQASPAHYPSEGSLHNPTTGQDVETCGAFDPADHLDDEVEEGGLVHQHCPIIGTVGKEMFDPGPALADGRYLAASSRASEAACEIASNHDPTSEAV